jgi:hypothetical protein
MLGMLLTAFCVEVSRRSFRFVVCVSESVADTITQEQGSIRSGIAAALVVCTQEFFGCIYLV